MMFKCKIYIDDEDFELDVVNYEIKEKMVIFEIIAMVGSEENCQPVHRLTYFYLTETIYEGKEKGFLILKSKTEIAEEFFYDRIELYDGEKLVFEYHTSPERRKNIIQKLKRELPASIERLKKFETRIGIFLCILSVIGLIGSVVFQILTQFAFLFMIIIIVSFALLFGYYVFKKPKFEVKNILKQIITDKTNFDR